MVSTKNRDLWPLAKHSGQTTGHALPVTSGHFPVSPHKISTSLLAAGFFSKGHLDERFSHRERKMALAV